VIVLAIIIEWFSHKEYERRFNYWDCPFLL